MTFDEWYNELEGYGLRSERAMSDIEPASPEQLELWLRAAYDQGVGSVLPVVTNLLKHAVYDREISDECIAAVQQAESFLALNRD